MYDACSSHHHHHSSTINRQKKIYTDSGYHQQPLDAPTGRRIDQLTNCAAPIEANT